MKQANLAFTLAVVALAVFYKLATRNKGAAQSATGGAPLLPLAASVNVPITEAAYHQGASDTAGAFGETENTDGEEVTSLQ